MILIYTTKNNFGATQKFHDENWNFAEFFKIVKKKVEFSNFESAWGSRRYWLITNSFDRINVHNIKVLLTSTQKFQLLRRKSVLYDVYGAF